MTTANKAPASPRRHRALLESILMAAAASAFFISWGVAANWKHGMQAIVQVATTQGVISFTSTFCSAEWLRFLYLSLKRRGISGYLTIPIGLVTINTAVYTAHYFAGTPELLLTMLPGAISSIFFCSGLTYRLHQAHS